MVAGKEHRSCKAVGNGRTALHNLAPYVFRLAISNRRLVELENGASDFSLPGN